MGMFRLPVTGDWIEGALIVGITAQGSEEAGYGLITVWVSDMSENSELQIFQSIEVSSLARAEQVRDQIAEMAELDKITNSSCFDPNDPDRGGPGFEEEGEDDDLADGGGGSELSGNGFGGAEARSVACSRSRLREFLESWQPDPALRH